MPHKYTVIHLLDKRNIIADLTWDAGKIQNGLETKNFGTSLNGNCSIVSKKELQAIDAKIHYLYKELYMDYFLDMVKEELQDPKKIKDFLKVSYGPDVQFDPSLITRYKFNLISRCFPLENLGVAEGNNYLKDLYNNFFTPEERKQINVFLLENEIDSSLSIGHTERLTCYIWKREDGKCDYFLYEQGQNLKQMDKEQLEERLSIKKYSSIRMSNFPSENLSKDVFR